MKTQHNQGTNNLKMFNPKHKEVYIERKQSEGYKENLRWLFSKTFDYENKFNRDLFNFTDDQLKDFFKSRNFSESTLKVYLSIVEEYIDWAIREGRTIRKTRPFEKTDRNAFIKEVSVPSKSYFHYKVIEEIVGIKNHGFNYPKLKNRQDQVMVYLAFLGVVGNNLSYMVNLKITDVNFDKNYIVVKEKDDTNRVITLNPYAMKLIEQAHNEKIYFKYAEPDTDFKGNIYSDLEDSEYILKKTNVGSSKSDKPVADVTLRKRLTSIREYLGEMNLTFNNLEKSGMLYLAKLIYDRDGYINAKNLQPVFERYRIAKTAQSESNTLSFIKKELKKVYVEEEFNF